MIRVSEGKYRIGDTKMLIFVRVSFPTRSTFSPAADRWRGLIAPY